MIIFIVFLPLFGFLYCAFFSKYFNDSFSQLVTTIFLFISSFLSWIIFIQYLGGTDVKVINLINWMTSGSFSVDWRLRIDALTATMLIVVTTVSACVHLYSIGYMSDDKSIKRFISTTN